MELRIKRKHSSGSSFFIIHSFPYLDVVSGAFAAQLAPTHKTTLDRFKENWNKVSECALDTNAAGKAVEVGVLDCF